MTRTLAAEVQKPKLVSRGEKPLPSGGGSSLFDLPATRAFSIEPQIRQTSQGESVKFGAYGAIIAAFAASHGRPGPLMPLVRL